MKLDLPGFSLDEKRMIACIARYHRKAHPSAAHAVYSDLNTGAQKRVAKLAAMLRIADGLDRCHEASCKRITAQRKQDTLHIAVEQRRLCPADIWGAQRKQGLFEAIFAVRVHIEAVPLNETNPARKAVS
jgi:exopolyphosphatase/guanosine-5'-triphosphate,3'-diphosphate pyrophosphatase